MYAHYPPHLFFFFYKHTFYLSIPIRLFSPLALRHANKVFQFFCLLFTIDTFSSVFKDNKLLGSHKTVEIKVFHLFACKCKDLDPELNPDRTNKYGGIQIPEVKKLTNLDPEHCIQFQCHTIQALRSHVTQHSVSHLNIVISKFLMLLQLYI